MNKNVPVIIYWQGSKKNKLSSALQYCTVAKFQDDVNWEDEAWSIVINFDIPPSIQGEKSKGFAKFLSPEGPAEKLKSGTKFELYEGNLLTAIVEIF